MRIFKKSLAYLIFTLYKYLHRNINLTGKGLVFYNSRLNCSYLKARIEIGNRLIMLKHSELISQSKLKIGNNFCINKFSRIIAFESIEIGNNVTIAQFVSILDHDHAYKFSNDNLKFHGYKTSPIKIGNNVWIGDKVTICKGVKIGDNVIIGANSVVTKDIENNCIAVGIPCRKYKTI